MINCPQSKCVDWVHWLEVEVVMHGDPIYQQWFNALAKLRKAEARVHVLRNGRKTKTVAYSEAMKDLRQLRAVEIRKRRAWNKYKSEHSWAYV